MRSLAALLLAAAVLVAAAASSPPGGAVGAPKIRIWKIHYRTHDGDRRPAWIVLPVWYGPRRNPPIPLVISPHGRAVSGRANASLWGALAAAGPFAVVNPDGQGRLLPNYSWGYWGQIEDLARMPAIVRRTLPWLRVDPRRVYAVGGSMGGQESLLLLARHPRLLAGVAVFDSVTDFALQYRNFPRLPCNRRCRRQWVEPLGPSLQALARHEIGGAPSRRPAAYATRSPITYARAIAASCVPLQIWWSNADRIVVDQQRQSAKLFWRLRRLNPYAPVQGFTGFWIHSAEMRAGARLPLALAGFGLLPPEFARRATGVREIPPPAEAAWC